MFKIIAVFLVIFACIYLSTKLDSEVPILRARLGTVLWHSSDQNGIYQVAYKDNQAVDHTYCYYPKSTAVSRLMLVRKDNGDCSDYLGEAIIHESSWVSEREKYWWSEE